MLLHKASRLPFYFFVQSHSSLIHLLFTMPLINFIAMNTGDFLKIKDLSPQLLVTDFHNSITYYQLLGFGISYLYQDFYASITKDGYSINLKLGKPVKEERVNRRKNEDLDIVFAVENIEKLYDVIMEIPVNIIQPLREMPYGREFYLSDPDGYLLGFIESN